MNRILVLSKDLSLRQKYTKELVKNGFHVADASDFLDGMLTATKTKFDVIIIDEEIYGISDHMGFSKIRKYSDAFIILLGKGQVNEVATGSDGFDAYFQRLANPQELVTYIKSIVSQPDARGGTGALKRETPARVDTQSESVISIMADLEQQIDKIRTVMIGLSQMRAKLSEAEGIVREQQRAFETVVNRLAEVNKHLDSLGGSQ